MSVSLTTAGYTHLLQHEALKLNWHIIIPIIALRVFIMELT